MWQRRYKPGDSVVYRKSKFTTHPGPRAQGVRASTKGDYYAYFVDKFWVVRKVLADGVLLVETRRGKTHLIDQCDPNLRRPSLMQRFLYRDRFAELRQLESAEN